MRSRLIAVVGIVALCVSIGVGMSLNSKQKTVIIQEEVVESLPEKPIKTINSYYPITKDSVWTYEMKDDDLTVSIDYIKDNVLQVRYTAQEGTVVKVYVEEEDALYEVASINDPFLKKDYTLRREYKDIVLKLPLEEGQSWTLKDGAIRTIESIEEIEYTKAGKFKILEVSTVHNDYEMRHCYGEKVGLVKIVSNKSGEKVVAKLQEYTTKRPLKTSIDAYYVNMRTQSPVLIRQEISVMTNEEPRHFLTDVMNIEPTENLLAPLPEEIEILAIYKDKEKDLVQIDLSHTYEETKYTKEEKEIAITCLVKTIGKYYEVGNVLMTVNGTRYGEVIDIRR